MQKLTRATWRQSVPEDLRAIGYFLGKAIVGFLTFEYRSMLLNLLAVFIFIRYEHVVDREAVSRRYEDGPGE